MISCPPVAFFVFNRPELTGRVLARIREAAPRMLFVVADGPRPNRPGEAEKCADVRRIVEAGIDWPCEVIRDYSPVNLGCARRVSSGLDAVFSRVEEAIILEEDCVPDPTFFRFCAELLARYRDEPRVAQIAGCSSQDPQEIPGRSSYQFSRYPHCWGWATWRRAWRHYDHEMTAWLKERDHSWLDRVLEHPAERKWWSDNFDATAAGKIDSWAFRWTVTVWHNGWLGILPYRNLVSNLGFGPEATHTHGADPAVSPPVSPMPFPLVHPASFSRDARADEYSSRLRFRAPGIAQRLLRRLQRLPL